MIDLQSLRHRPPEPAPAPERATKSGDYDVRKTSWGEEWTPATQGERATKAAAPLAKGAKSESESRILNAVRKAPALSIADLARTTRLPEITVQLAWNALMHRGGLVREEAGLLGTTRLVAVQMAND